MSFTVKAINVGQYVMVMHEGHLIKKEFEEARLIVKRMLDENNWNKLLIDVRNAVDRVPVAEVYYVMKTISTALPFIKIALLFPPERREEGEFAETVAMNRGVRLKYFLDYGEAAAWLAE